MTAGEIDGRTVLSADLSGGEWVSTDRPVPVDRVPTDASVFDAPVPCGCGERRCYRYTGLNTVRCVGCDGERTDEVRR